MDASKTQAFVEQAWQDSILATLQSYIEIPNKSPSFDPAWAEHGYMDQALDLLHAWCREHGPSQASIEVHRLPGRTPVMLIDVPGDETAAPVMFYGHFDKQPEMTGWRDGLGPWTPVLEGDRLYGRGGADDGYSTFAALTAIRALEEQGIPHARCLVLIEASEESGSIDLPAHLEALAPAISTPGLIVCLDSGCGNYDQLWGTTSLRGVVGGTLSVEVLSEGVHSGTWSGVVSSSFRIARMLLSRIEDETTGKVLLPEFHVEVPRDRLDEVERLAESQGEGFHAELPLVSGMQPVTTETHDLILNSTWRPTLSVTGADGLPPIESAGNVLRPYTRLKLSLRIPPTADPGPAMDALKRTLEADPPYGARVAFEPDHAARGWNAPVTASWLQDSIERASNRFFGRPAAYKGEGGTIPFLAMLGERFPEAQFFVTGVLGPGANAHGPNEFLHVPTFKRLTCSVAHVIADQLASR